MRKTQKCSGEGQGLLEVHFWDHSPPYYTWMSSVPRNAWIAVDPACGFRAPVQVPSQTPGSGFWMPPAAAPQPQEGL